MMAIATWIKIFSGRLASAGFPCLALMVSVIASPAFLLAYPGELDTSFGGGGIFLYGTAGDQATDLAIQPDGKIVLAGVSTGDLNAHIWPTVPNDFAVIRLNADGTLDASFGTNGKVTTDFGGSSDIAYAVVLQPAGKVIAAGISTAGDTRYFALARYHSDGTLDASFDGDGKLTTEFGGSNNSGVQSLFLQSDGKIVAAGTVNTGNWNFVVVRYNSDGTLDTTFDGDGMTITDIIGRVDGASAVLVQPDGKIVAGGYTNVRWGTEDFALVRYNSDGTLDASFGTGGKVVTDFNANSTHDAINDLALQTDGKIVAVGKSNTWNDNPNTASIGIVRYNADGTLDTTFGTNGKVSTDFGGPGNSAAKTAIDSNGGIVVTAQGPRYLVASYRPDGTLDPAFDSDGWVSLAVRNANDKARGLALQSDGKIVVVGDEYTTEASFGAVYFPGRKEESPFCCYIQYIIAFH